VAAAGDRVVLGLQFERWAWASIGLNIGLVVVHALIAVVSGSLAVVAEAVHNGVDLVSSVAVLIGLRLARRTSERFPYGLHKVENVIAAGVAGLVFFTAYEITREALLRPAADVAPDAWMLIALALSTVAPLLFSRFELRAATAANSPALIAQAREYRIHAATTGLAFASVAAAWSDVPVDRVATILIVGVVAKTGWDLLRDAMRVLLDASLDRLTLDRVAHVIRRDPSVTDLTWITGRNAGRFCFVEAGIMLRVTAVDGGPTAVARIETAIRRAVPNIDRVLLHLETRTSPYTLCAIPLDDTSGTVSAHFGQAPYFAIVTVRHDDRVVHEQRILANPHHDTTKAKGIRVAEWLVSHKVDVVFTREALHGKGPAHVLAEAGIELTDTDAAQLADVMAGGLLTASPPVTRYPSHSGGPSDAAQHSVGEQPG
jgi:cation diffusion facilitator family transporter